MSQSVRPVAHGQWAAQVWRLEGYQMTFNLPDDRHTRGPHAEDDSSV